MVPKLVEMMALKLACGQTEAEIIGKFGRQF